MDGNVLVLWIGGFPGTLILATEVGCWLFGDIGFWFWCCVRACVTGICALFTWKVFLGVCVSWVCIIYGC